MPGALRLRQGVREGTLVDDPLGSSAGLLGTRACEGTECRPALEPLETAEQDEGVQTLLAGPH
jgi:hypothetical protein